MPRYEFTCPSCGLSFEKTLAIQESQTQVRCPSVHGNVRRVYTAAAVLFRGSGFYVTDQRAKPSQAESENGS